MLTAASVMISGFGVARDVHDEAMADPASSANAGLPRNHRAHQLVGVQAALHQGLGLAGSDELDRLGGRVVAVFRIDHARLSEMSRPLSWRRGAIRSAGPTRMGSISPRLRRLDRPAQRHIVARMRDGDLDRRFLLGGRNQAMVLFPPADFRIVGHACCPPDRAIGDDRDAALEGPFGSALSARPLFGGGCAKEIFDLARPLLALGRQLARGADELPERSSATAAPPPWSASRIGSASMARSSSRRTSWCCVVNISRNCRSAQPLVRLARLANDFQHPVAAFVEGSVGLAHIDQRAQHGLLEPPSSNFCAEAGPHLAASASRVRSRSIRSLGAIVLRRAEADHRLQDR